MAAFLGMRGTGDWGTDERPKNWREMILYLFPNGEAPLTAILSKLKSQPTNDPEFNWWEKSAPTQRMALSAESLAADTSLDLTSGAKDCVTGTILMHEASGELLKVTSNPSSDTALVVSRSYGSIAAGTLAAADYLVIVGNVHEEGAGVPAARAYSPSKVSNYTQIFRTSLSVTRTAKKTRLMWDSTGPYREAKREALSLHSIEMEKNFIFGEAVETTGPLGKPERMTAGILAFLTTNAYTLKNVADSTGDSSFYVNGILDEPTWDSLMEKVFRYGSTNKLCLCGSTFIGAISTLAKRNGTLNMVPSDKSYGMKIVEYLSTYGTLQMKMHPLFNQHSEWRKDALILDVDGLIYRYVDDTKFVRNRQDPGTDAALDEFLTEAGLELHFEEKHAHIRGVTGALVA